jgi:hypothetical protein
MTTTFACWVCSTPDCAYTISGMTSAVHFHKGRALTEERTKGDKEWVEFDF